MITITCQNKRGTIFDRIFETSRQARRFVLRVQHGDSLMIIDVKGFDGLEEYYYIMGENI